MPKFLRSSRLTRIAAISVVTVIYTLIRLHDLDRLVTTDEPFWMGRSANFYRAIRTGDLQYTYQMAHPGVLTMWAGALAFFVRAPEYSALVHGNLKGVYSIESVLRTNHIDPLDMMVAVKVSKVLLQGIFFAVTMTYLKELIGIGTAAIAGLLIAFDPFLSGLDSAFHVDGLFSLVCFAAVASIVFAASKTSLTGRTGRLSWYWVASGLLSACAWLTRATGVVLLGVVGLVLLFSVIDVRRQNKPDQTKIPGVRNALHYAMIWLFSAIATTCLLLPALWVAPGKTLSKLWEWTSTAATEGHENSTFFMGEIHRGDPGLIFYPVAITWRSTPVEWYGMVVLIALTPWSIRRRTLTPSAWRLIIFSTVFAIVYAAAMSTGVKKFDRYALPMFPVICLLAAVGIITLVKFAAEFIPRYDRVLAGVTVTALVLIQSLSTWVVLPYRLDYYNPLLGGPRHAESVMQMGWGQGGVEVVEYITGQLSGDQQVIMQTSAVPSAFSYFLSDDPKILIRSFGLATPAGWFETDYYVAGIQQTQRDMAPSYRTLRRYGYEPEHIITIGGVPYFQIFRPHKLPIPSELQKSTGCDMTFDGSMRLMQIVGRESRVDLYWQTVSLAAVNTISVSVQFVDPDGRAQSFTGKLDPAPAGAMSRVRLDFPRTSSEFALSEYQIIISLTDSVTGDQLAASTPWNGEPKLSVETQSECYYIAPPAF